MPEYRLEGAIYIYTAGIASKHLVTPLAPARRPVKVEGLFNVAIARIPVQKRYIENHQAIYVQIP